MSRLGLMFIVFFSSFWGAFYFCATESFVNPYPIFCSLVKEKIYLESSAMQEWQKLCESRGKLVSPFTNKKIIISDMKALTEKLQISHFEIYDPREVKNLWQAESEGTGIESEFVDSELVVFEVHPGSPAHQAGVRMGDIIKAIDDEQPSPWGAQKKSGQYLFVRDNEEKKIELIAANFVRDESMKFKVVNGDTGLIKVASFRKDFFQDQQIATLVPKLAHLRNVIVDLRGNIGGNFVAGLRFLSLFICQKDEVGRLIHPKSNNNVVVSMPNQLEDELQIQLLENSREVTLDTFAPSFCSSARLRVLVDGKTASVAEMVAQALKELRSAKILGGPSGGKLLVGVWYPFKELGPGVEVSIPEAVFNSKNKRQIEGQGVDLDQVFYYDLREIQSGIDSWVQKALD